MLGQDNSPGSTPQVWFGVLMALLVLALLGSIFLSGGEADNAVVSAFVERQITRLVEAQAEASPAVTEEASVTLTPQDLLSAEAMPDDLLAEEQIEENAPEPNRTLKPPDAPRQDHYWLERPIAAPGTSRVARFYPYGSRLDGSYPIHVGVEMVNPAGTPVRAPASGVVVVADSDDTQVYGARTGFYGLLVVLQLDQRYQGMPVYVLFAHLSETQVSIGQHVAVGEVLGLVGETGYAEAPHLHNEVRIGRNDYYATVNPELWYRPLENHGTLAGLLLAPDGQPVTSEVRLVLSRGGGGIYELYTYPTQTVNPDPEWGENFCIGDLEAGQWTLEVFYRGVLHRRDVTIQPGRTTWVVIGGD